MKKKIQPGRKIKKAIRGCQWSQGRLILSQVVITSKHPRENHDEFSVEPREHAEMGIQIGFETIQVEMKEKGREKDAKDGNGCPFGEEELRRHDPKGGEKCLIGDPEVWMVDENIFAVYLFHEETRDQPMSGDLEKKNVPKIVREAVSRFKEKSNE